MSDNEAAHAFRLAQAKATIAIVNKEVNLIVKVAKLLLAESGDEGIEDVAAMIRRDDFESLVYAGDKQAFGVLTIMFIIFQEPTSSTQN